MNIQLTLPQEFFGVIAVVVTFSIFLRSQAHLFNAVVVKILLMMPPDACLLPEQAPAGRKSRAKRAANENVIVHIPDRCLPRPSFVKQVV